MLKNEEELYVVSEILENTGDSLYRKPDNTRRLKLMQQRISDIARASVDMNLTFLSQFLGNYINRLWNNLAVDFTYEGGGPGKEILERLIKDVGQRLIKLSRSIKEGNLEEYHGTFLELTKVYRESLRELISKKEEIERVKLKYGRIKYPDRIRKDKRKLFEILEESGAVTQSEYSLAGGVGSNYFFDMDKLLSKEKYIDVISDYYLNQIKNYKIKKLAFIEKDVGTVGTLPMMSSIVSKTKIEGLVARIWKEIPIGKIKYSKDARPKKGERIGIVSDVATSSESIVKAANALKDLEVDIPYAFVLYDREQGAKKILSKYGIELRSVLTKSELLEVGFIEPPKEPEPNFDEKEMNVIPPALWKLRKYKEKLSPETLKLMEKVSIGRKH